MTFVGYEDLKRENINVKGERTSLGTILIQEKTKVMDEVVVRGNKVSQPVKATMQGLEIRPDQTISNVGGTLLDILRNTPSINVSDEGGVTLRGSGSTNVLIDGRNSALTTDLEQIPASAIKKVEIINNPNAKYDAASDGGVINIILRQGEDIGTTGKVELTSGTRMRTNASLNLSHKTEEFAVYGGYSYRTWPRVGSGQTIRETYSDQERLEQVSENDRNDKEHTVNYGADYYFGQNKLSLEGVFNTENEDDFESSSTSLTDLETGEPFVRYVRNNNEVEENYTTDNALIYERFFDNEIQSFRALASYSIRDQQEDQNIDVFNNTLIDENRAPDRLERSMTDEVRNTGVLQIDYTHPLGEGKLETGYKTTLRYYDNDYNYEFYNDTLNQFMALDSVSNRFKYEDQVHALYAIYTNSWGQLNYALGVRAEQTYVRGELVDTDEVNKQDYLNLFPSVQADYPLNDVHTIKATYSRRIDRPSARRLNPFPDFSDSLNVRIGDPALQPEYINSFELGHMMQKGGFSLATNAFYRRITGQIDYVVRIEDGISYRGPQNLNVSNLYGVELINTTEVTDWWSVNASYSLFQVRVDGSNLNNSFTNKGTSWYAKLTTELALPLGIDFQLTGNYTAPEIEAQGSDNARYYVDASLQKSFINDKFALSASFRDIFDTRNFSGENYGPDFRQTFEYNRETQIVLVTASYKFSNN